MKKLVVLTGAGISAESGLKTFRDSDGLWNGYNVEDVATPQAFKTNPQLVLDFYNQRRADVNNALPNQGHFALAELEKHMEVVIITQNIDNLHERAGSTKVLHLHGEINKMRSVNNEHQLFDAPAAFNVGDLAEDGGQLRPHIVWFGEPVPLIEKAIQIGYDADFFAVIGTSLLVYPAASLLQYIPKFMPVYIVNKKIPELNVGPNYTLIEEVASTGVIKLKTELLKKL
jgi:NAD-dependent deacetylase